MKKLSSFFLLVLFLGCSAIPPKPSPVFVGEGDKKIETLPSSYTPLVQMGNVHSLRSDHRVLRGASPLGKGQLLKSEGVTDVIIFRDSVGEDVQIEKQELSEVGISESRIHSIPMKWRDFPSMESACSNVLAALKVIAEVEQNPPRKVYFHCTVGEDRTGILAGLFRMLYQDWSAERSFQKELCAHGFGSASARKPKFVADAVEKDLKTLYAFMADQIELKKLTKDDLNRGICSQLKETSRSQEIRSFQCH